MGLGVPRGRPEPSPAGGGRDGLKGGSEDIWGRWDIGGTGGPWDSWETVGTGGREDTGGGTGMVGSDGMGGMEGMLGSGGMGGGPALSDARAVVIVGAEL